MTFRLKEEDRPRIVWLLALLVLILGWRAVAARESTIARSISATEELSRRIKANESAIEQAAALRARERSAWTDLLQLSRDQRTVLSVAAFLRQLQNLAERFHMSVVSLAPSDNSPPAKAASSALFAVPVTIVSHGEFHSILRFIQEITRQKTLTGFESAQITLSPPPSNRDGRLSATIRLTLYRLALRLSDAPAN